MKIPYTRYLAAALLLAVSLPVLSQEQPSLRDRADLLYRKYEYAGAVALYGRLADTRNPRLVDLERLAEGYRLMNDYESSENWYARLVGHGDSRPEHLLGYAEVLKAQGKYAEAKQQLEAYASRTGDRAGVSVQLAGCDSAEAWLASPTPHRLRNEAGVNTSRSEFSAFPSGGRVYYAGEPASGESYGWTGAAYLRVYSATAGTAGLSSPGLFEGPANGGGFHAGPVAASADGRTLYVTRTYPGRSGLQHTREGGHRFRTHALELYVHRDNGDGSWSSEPFAHNDPGSYSVGHAALSPDGRTLYFASDMPGGHGGTDIWYSELESGGTWGRPVNAGPSVNTAGDELFPSVGPDGTLYYSSDGLAGMGGLDIFRAEGSRGEWSRPENLRHPVNSPGDDFAFVVSGQDGSGMRGYLSSNRRGGAGGDDIYSFGWERPQIILLLKGTSSDRSTGDRLAGVSVSLYDGGRELVARRSSDGSGNFEFAVSPGHRYTVLGQKAGYHADSARVSTEGIATSDTLEVALLLEPVFRKGQAFELEDIYYDFDRHDIRPDAAAVLDELVRTMRDNPTLRIELSSHTDSRGSHAYNEALSQRRAQSAVDYLVSRGIARERMVAQGYGERRLANRCADGVPCSREEHQANRRTMVTVLDY